MAPNGYITGTGFGTVPEKKEMLDRYWKNNLLYYNTLGVFNSKMASKSPQSLLRMRDMFIGASKQQTHWFPGHMAKGTLWIRVLVERFIQYSEGLRVMEQHIARCDGFIEVHDARIPGDFNQNHSYHFILFHYEALAVILSLMCLRTNPGSWLWIRYID